MTDNEKDIENNIFDKLFKVKAVSSVDNSWRAATIFSKEETFENEKEKFISDELIYKTMTKWRVLQFQETLYCKCYKVSVDRIKECDRCHNWFYEVCERFAATA